MCNKIFKSPLIILLLLFTAAAGMLHAQSGKLVGKVTDAETGEALIGANIIIAGTNLGAAADLSGNYIIPRIPPAIYSVTASIIGYAKTTVTEVEIIIDRTIELNFKLRNQSVQLEQVIVTAEKPKIVKDQTSTTSTLNFEQIKAAPIEGIRGALDLSSEFGKNDKGNYSIRGSGSYEVNFQINGVEQIQTSTTGPASAGADKANNSWKYDVNPLGVSQIQLITGGFAAEYGNAQAGIVKVVLKEGTQKISGEVRMEYRPPGQYHFGDYLYSRNNYEWKKWGDLNSWMSERRNEVVNDLRLNQADRYKYLYDKLPNDSIAGIIKNIEDREIAWAYETWVRNHTPSDDNPLGVYAYTQYAYTRYLIGLGGPLGKDPNLLRFYFSGEYRKNPTRLPTPEKNQVYQNYIFNLTYQPIQDHKFKFMGSFQKYRGGIWSGSDDVRWAGIPFVPGGLSQKYLVSVDPVRTEQTVSQSLNWVYTMSGSSFVEATISHQNEFVKLPYEFLISNTQEADKLDSLYDPRGSLLRTGQWWETGFYREPFNFSTNYYQDSRTNHYSASFDYNNIVKTNNFKAGLKFYYWDLFNNAVNSSFQANSYVARSGYAEYYKAYPINAAFYLQDKMEFEGMIANVGVRGEAFNFQTNNPVDLFDPFYPGKDGPGKTEEPYGNPVTAPATTQYILLPRVGVSFPIGENTAFRMQYGHFASMPVFSQALAQRTDKGWILRGNPNLDYKKSINYEFGLQQLVDENNRLDVALFYNDSVTQIGTQRIASYTGSQGPSGGIKGYADGIPLYPYTTYNNNAFGSTIGITFTFEKVNIGEWHYRLSYTLSQTTEGNYGAPYIYPDNSRNQSRSYTNEYLGYYDRTHNFRAYVQYALKDDEGLSIFGIKPFTNTVFSLTYTAQSGLPFTYFTDFDLKDLVNNRRYPLESEFNLNATKEIDLAGYNLILGVRVSNLFNNKLITPLTGTDLIDWLDKGITMDNPAEDPFRRSYVTAAFKTYRNIPRQVFFTVGFGF